MQVAPKYAFSSVKLGNHGRTPAVIAADCLRVEVSAALPTLPNYDPGSVEHVASSRIVNKGDSYLCSRKIVLAEEQLAAIFGRTLVLWVYGYLEYVDFLKRQRRMGYCVAFEPRPDVMYPDAVSTTGVWVLKGPKAYSYDQLIA